MKTPAKNLYAQALMAVVVIIGLYFMWSFAREVVQAQRLSNQVELGQQANARLQAENRDLARQAQYYASDDYVRLRARSDLNLRAPDEVVVYPLLTPTVVPAGEESAAAGGTAAGGSAAEASAPAAPVDPNARTWERWLTLFTNPNQ